MKKIRNVILIGLLLFGIFGVVSPVYGAPCSSIGTYNYDVLNGLGGNGYVPSKDYAIYFDVTQEVKIVKIGITAAQTSVGTPWNYVYMVFSTGDRPYECIGCDMYGTRYDDNRWTLYAYNYDVASISGKTINELLTEFVGVPTASNGNHPCSEVYICTTKFNGSYYLPFNGTWSASTGTDIDALAPYTLNRVELAIIDTSNAYIASPTHYAIIEQPCDPPEWYVPPCGDGICNGDENCSSCELDCGSCYSGTVTNTLTPSVALTGETVSGTVILTDGISRQKPDSVTLTVNGASLVTTSGPLTNDENFTHYEFVPASNSLSQGDHVITAVANYNGTDYTGTATLTVSPPGEGTPPINPGDEGEVQDNIKWTFKFTKDVFDSSDYTPNYGVAGYYVVSAVPVVNNVDIPQYDAYVTVKVDSKIVLNNKYKHYLAFSGSSGSTEPFYFDMPTSAVNIDGECLINYNYYGTPRTITLKDTSKFSLSGNGGGNGGGDSDGKSIFTKVWEGVKGVAGDVWDGVYGKAKEVAGDAKEAVEDIGPDIYKALQTVTSDVWKAVSSTASKTFESVVKTVTGGSSGGSIFSGLGSFLSKAVYGIPVIFIVIGVVLIFVLRRD